MKNSEDEETDNNNIVIGSVVASSQHQIAIYEAGKSMLLESIGIGRDFCKFMITISTSAIPLYLGLLKFIYPNDLQIKLSSDKLFWILLPCILFLISMTIFVLGLLPKLENFSLDSYKEIESARTKMINKRMKYIKSGIFVFAVSIIVSSIIIIKLIVK